MDIEGKYILPTGEVLEVHINVAVNTWKDGSWVAFHQCSVEEFRYCMHVVGEDVGPVKFEPKTEAS